MKKLSVLALLVALAACGGGHNGTLHISPPSLAHIITPQKPAGESGAIPNPPPEPPVVVPATPSMELEPLMVDPDRDFNAISRIMGRLEDGESVMGISRYDDTQRLYLTKLDNGINALGIHYRNNEIFVPAHDYTNIAIRPNGSVLLTADDISPEHKNMSLILGGNTPITTYIDGQPIETKLSYMDWGIWQDDRIISPTITDHLSRGFVVEDTAPYCGGLSCKITPEALPAGNYKFYGNTHALVSERYQSPEYNWEGYHDNYFVHTERTGKVVLEFNPAAMDKSANLTLDFDNWHTIQLNNIALNGQVGYYDLYGAENRMYVGETPNPNFTASISDGGKTWDGKHYRIEDFITVYHDQKTSLYGKNGNPREAAGSYIVSFDVGYPPKDDNLLNIEIWGAFGAVRGN